MAIFGKLSLIEKQLNSEAFTVAFNYLNTINDDFFTIQEGECIKESLSNGIFVLKQAYTTKNQEACFFESHKKYIDIQFMVQGEEIMDVARIEDLTLLEAYNETTDFIKYEGNKNISRLHIKEKELAIFYPEDAHQPCIKVNNNELIYKAVIKIPVENV